MCGVRAGEDQRSIPCREGTPLPRSLGGHRRERLARGSTEFRLGSGVWGLPPSPGHPSLQRRSSLASGPAPLSTRALSPTRAPQGGRQIGAPGSWRGGSSAAPPPRLGSAILSPPSAGPGGRRVGFDSRARRDGSPSLFGGAAPVGKSDRKPGLAFAFVLRAPRGPREAGVGGGRRRGRGGGSRCAPEVAVGDAGCGALGGREPRPGRPQRVTASRGAGVRAGPRALSRASPALSGAHCHSGSCAWA